MEERRSWGKELSVLLPILKKLKGYKEYKLARNDVTVLESYYTLSHETKRAVGDLLAYLESMRQRTIYAATPKEEGPEIQERINCIHNLIDRDFRGNYNREALKAMLDDIDIRPEHKEEVKYFLQHVQNLFDEETANEQRKRLVP